MGEGSEGSNATTIPSGIKTTVPEGSDDFTTVPTGIKTTVPEGSNSTTVSTGNKTTVPEGSDDFTSTLDVIVQPPTIRTTVPAVNTLPVGPGCKDGIPIGIDLEWFHIHDSSSSMKNIHNESATALKSVVDVINKSLLSENTSDRLSFSLVEAHDKSGVCSLFDADCSCADIAVDQLSLSQMSCSLDSGCSDESLFNEDMYIDIPSRPSLFDPLMTLSQSYSDAAQTGSKKIRFVTMMTDACSRVSGRTASSPNLAKKYWEYINSRVYTMWMSVDAGIDKNTGVVTEDVCDLRDYPTVDELSMNLSNSSMGVAVVFTGRENDACADVEDYSKGEFWSVVGEATDNLNVPFTYSSASGNSVDMADKLLAGIQSIFSDVCSGPEETGATTIPTVIETTVAEGSSATTVPSGIKTTVSEGPEGPSNTTVLNENESTKSGHEVVTVVPGTGDEGCDCEGGCVNIVVVAESEEDAADVREKLDELNGMPADEIIQQLEEME